MKKHIVHWILPALLAVAVIPTTWAQNKASPPLIIDTIGKATSTQSVNWLGGTGVQVCANGGCLIRSLPRAAGTPSAVVPGPFIHPRIASGSWIVVSNTGYSLCYFTVGSTKQTVCRPVKMPAISGATIAMQNHYGLQVLTVTIPPSSSGPDKASQVAMKSKLLKLKSALWSAQVGATKNAAKRYAGRLIPLLQLADAGGGGCYSDEDGAYCEGGEGGGGGGGGGGDYPVDNGPDPSGDPDGDTSSNNSVPTPLIPFPPGITPNGSGGTTTCIVTPIGMTCVTTAPRPVIPGYPTGDPFDPPLPVVNPPSNPDGNWWCGIPVIGGWLCGGSSPPAPTNTLPPLPPIPDDIVAPPSWPIPITPFDGRPIQRYREGYDAAREQCETDRDQDEKRCGLDYNLRGGPIYRRKQDAGETLTATERKYLKEANVQFSSCMVKVGDAWGNCIQQAMNDFRDNGNSYDPLKTGSGKK